MSRLEAYASEILELAKECVITGCLECCAVELADIAVKHGLWQYVPYEPELHGTGLLDDYEPGDMIYWWEERCDNETIANQGRENLSQRPCQRSETQGSCDQ